MCGILGLLDKDEIDPVKFRLMRDSMLHRGPDGFGEKYLKEGKVALGHRRLSIIDLSESGEQPMSNEDGSLWLTFNGEIYNYPALRRQLVNSGHTFKSNTDSEVLIHGFEEWGMQGLLEKIKGMFAFGIYDVSKDVLYAARDRFGIKPFVYYFDGNKFIFASEIKAIMKSDTIYKDIRSESIAEYLSYGYVPHPHTPWKKIFKLQPAHFIKFSSSNGNLEIFKYWQLEAKNNLVSQEEAVEESSRLLKKSVGEHLTSDVPVGLFLSGGYDSTSILKYTSEVGKPLNTYTIGFHGSKNSEHVLAEEISAIYDSPNFARVLTEEEDYWKILLEQAQYYDEPYAVSSMMPYYYVSKLAARDRKVILGGDGGDEVFAGYRWQKEIFSKMKNRNWKSKLKDLAIGEQWRILHYYNQNMTGIHDQTMLFSILKDSSLINNIRSSSLGYFKKNYKSGLPLIKRIQSLDINTFLLEACLMRADQTSMIHSLEVRLPFLDHELMEYVFSLHPSVYFEEFKKKILLEKKLKSHIPAHILKQPKRGFGFQQLNALFGSQFEQTMRGGELEKLNIIKTDINWSEISVRIKFHLVMLELWFKRFAI